MKIERKEDKGLVKYEDINFGECFEYNGCVYFKCYNIPGGKIYNVDLWRGLVSPSLLDNDDLVKPLLYAKVIVGC